MPESNNKRIVKNTMFLYLRMAIIMFVNLFVVRVVLRALGVEDFGIYNVVAGIVTLFTFISNSLSSGAQRFFAVDISKNLFEKLKTTFSITLYIYGGIGILSVLLLETFGVWFLNTKLHIPETRLVEANWVFQFAILTFLGNIFTIPFNAAVIAFEKMSFFAYLSIAEVLARLLVALSILYISSNKLILYSELQTMVSLVILTIYIIYSRKKLYGCTIVRVKNYSLSWSLLKYSGWNMIGSLAILGRNQGLTILLNIFFSPIVSAAQTIGQQVYGAINQLVTNVYIASRPQITKYHATGEINSMWDLIFMSGKVACFLLLLLAIPLVICIDFVLQLWLVDVPDYTAIICRCLIISLIIETFVNQLFGGFQAANRLKKVQSFSSSILLLNIPISYFILKLIPSIIMPYIVIIILSMCYALSIIIVAKLELRMSIKDFFRNLLLPSLLVCAIAPIIPLLVHQNMKTGWSNFIITTIISLLCSCISIWLLGLNRQEKKRIMIFIKSRNP